MCTCAKQLSLFFFKVLNLALAGDEVISGVDSFHDDYYEDRVWGFKICKISQF